MITRSHFWTVACSEYEIWTAGASAGVQIFDRDGNFLQNLSISTPELAISASGDAYLVKADYFGFVVCGVKNKVVRSPEIRLNTDGPFDFAVDSSQDRLFIAEGVVRVFTTSGARVLELGSYGRGPGEFSRGVGSIAVNTYTRELAVSDHGNDRVQVRLVFSPLSSFLQIFDYDGKFLRKFGDAGHDDGELRDPGALACDSMSNWLCCDTGNKRVQVFSRDGLFITAFGIRMSPHSSEYGEPTHICVDNTDRILVIADGVVHVFAFAWQPQEPPRCSITSPFDLFDHE